MKTRLLLLFLFVTAFVNVHGQVFNPVGSSNITTESAFITSRFNLGGIWDLTYQLVTGNSGNLNTAPLLGLQVSAVGPLNISQGLGVVPNTVYFYRFRAQNNSGVVHFSDTGTFTTLSSAPIISAPGASFITTSSANIGYNIRAMNSSTTSIIKYGIDANTLSSQVSGHSATGNINTSGSTPLTGLLPNTQYFYQIEATNSIGTSTSTVLNFTTLVLVLPQILANYTFDNTLNNVNGANPFALQTGMIYGTDRSGTINKALFIDGTGTTASLTNLPVGGSSRTFSIWIKPTTNNSSNRIFSYGAASGTGAYGASFDAARVYNFSWTNNLPFLQSTPLNVWKHIVCTYEQSTNTASLYTDGVLRASGTYSWSTANATILYLGSLFGDAGSRYIGFLDDLQIYNYALTQTQVTNLFSGNSVLSSQNFQSNNLKFNLYPNPATDILNISMETELKSVEIYSLLGQKVLASNKNQMDVSSLSKGMYMVRVEDVEGSVSTQKLIVE